MDFTQSEAQAELSGLARRILADHGADSWPHLRDSGLLALDFGLLEQVTLLVEIGRSAAHLPYLSSIVLGASTVVEHGTAEQVEQFAKPASTGELILTAALPGAVSADSNGVTWTLTGVKTAVPYAVEADWYLVTTDAGVFLVSKEDVGVSVEAQRLVDESPAGRLTLTQVSLSADRFLGDSSAASWLTTRAVVGECALQLGVCERALELTATYANTRVQFERPIGSFQAVAQRLADAYIDVEAIRLTLWQAAWRLAEGLDCPTEVDTAKFWAADAGHRVAHTAVHVHGGVGIDLDHSLHRYFIAAKRHEFALGGATAHLLNIGAHLAR